MSVTFGDWFSEMVEHLREQPSKAPLYLVFTVYLTVWYAITSRWPVGEGIYEFDWDVLLVLDACRVDALREVADEYDFIEEVESKWSVGSQSAEWIANTFTESWKEEIKGTTYISGNGYSDAVLAGRHFPPANNTTPLDLASWSVVYEYEFQSHIAVWETYHDETYGSVLPEPMTDYTIEVGRRGNSERIITHYTQPHLPYVGTAFREGRKATEREERGYELLQEGRASCEDVYNDYLETLRWVLDDVEELLENIDAGKVVITSDHGEAFGEWHAYGHPEGFPHPVVRRVPWVETTATDEHTREPDIDFEEQTTIEVEEHLRDLGYR
ncbi:sulfatase-like hydrolase/transferase [Halorarum salinum]|uniref:Sulfatase-like hydrolase/transferase n=1 Tax=Halorarum salinum TaxID=2743089 RepID=A0A7D5QBI2_9EURY|nr:sulfatase-like hydrolase/transferase [Halobaculum salinum]QLG63396.1 sulfatase-like hydrolase/transferase [Halobaculum salinum]